MQAKPDYDKIKYIIREKKVTPNSTTAEYEYRHMPRCPWTKHKDADQIPLVAGIGLVPRRYQMYVWLVLAECTSGGSGVGRVTNWRADHIYNNEKARTGRTVPGKVDKMKTGKVRAHVL